MMRKEEELRALLAKKPAPVCYDGFEPSGRMHIAQGVMKALNVNKLTKTGCVFKFWVADWFAYLNNKMGGDLKKIRKVGEYMIEVWKAIGMDMERVEFIWTSDEINSRAAEYWPLVMDIARVNNLKRIIRCSQIMGRSETSEDGGGGSTSTSPRPRSCTPACSALTSSSSRPTSASWASTSAR